MGASYSIKITKDEINSLSIYELKDIHDFYDVLIVSSICDSDIQERRELLENGYCNGRFKVTKSIYNKLSTHI